MRKIVLLAILVLITACAKTAVEVPKSQHEPMFIGKEEQVTKEDKDSKKGNKTANLEELEGLKKLSPEDISPDMIAKAQNIQSDVTQEKGALAQMIHFDFDSYELNAEAKKVLEDIAAYLNEYKTVKIVIEGHCDERGTREYNLALGMKRAEVAKKYLADLGVDDARLDIVSYGEDKPYISGSGEEVWSKNRRDQFKRVQ